MTNETTSPVEVTQAREWTRWSDQRPPNAPGEYRYRAGFDLLGVPVTAEWTEKMSLCGMGYGDSEWWPLSPCYWNGYRRYITIDNLEWSATHAYDQDGVLWSGLELAPCPFTGKAPKVEAQGQHIGAPLWRTEAIWLSSPAIPKRRWTDAKAMQTAWNTRWATDNAPAPERMPTSPAVVRLVVASRELVFSDHRPSGAPETQAEVELIDLFTELDEATEAFAELVPWDEQPDETVSAMEGEG